MSFGTFTLFNFYQQPNTGVTPLRSSLSAEDINSIVNGLGRPGKVADFNWPFPYAGTNIPVQLIEGGGALFTVPLLSDSDIGLRHAFVESIFYGSFTGQIEYNYYKVGLSGEFFPQDKDFNFYRVGFSGVSTGSPPDINQHLTIVSGNIIGGQQDNSVSIFLFSGKFDDDSPEISYLNDIFSGKVINDKPDIETSKFILYGKLIRADSDINNISYNFSGFSSKSNIIINDIILEDEKMITYGFNSYSSFRS
jgi:hypothetical protein